jgi:hypothetical protein
MPFALDAAVIATMPCRPEEATMLTEAVYSQIFGFKAHKAAWVAVRQRRNAALIL